MTKRVNSMSKTVLITGSSTGFGNATAKAMVEQGHTVYASMRDPLGKNKAHADELVHMGARVIELDVTDTRSVERAVKHIHEQSDRLDVLINNAGIASAGVSEAFSEEQVTALFDVNVVGVHRVCQAVLPMFRQQRDGLIINIGSILGRVTFPFFGIYGASKFAVEALTDSLRHEVSQFGVDVTLVQPSAYPTSMYDKVQQPEKQQTVDDYGEIGQIPAQMFEHFMSLFSADDAPNPYDVTEAVLELMNTPKGERPNRRVVGADFGAVALNEAAAPVQKETVKALGLEALATI